jgi:hypothetical protein
VCLATPKRTQSFALSGSASRSRDDFKIREAPAAAPALARKQSPRAPVI